MSNQRVVITGASTGIGAEFARQYHAKGAQVVLIARREDLLRGICDDLNQVRSGSASFIIADLSKNEDLGRIASYLSCERVDIFVNNAGRGSFGYFETIPIEEELEQIQLNVVATARLAHAVIPQMKQRRGGAIIATCSVAGFQPLPIMATYGATKAFNLSHSLALHYELKPFGVKVLAVCPGPTSTDFKGMPRIKGKITGMPRDRIEDVVRDSISALDAGKAWVVPCRRSRLLSFPFRVLPRSFCTKLVGMVLNDSLRAVCQQKKE